MHDIIFALNIFMLPPLITLITSVIVASIAVFKGKRKKENILFALFCLWYALLTPNFLGHFVIKDVNFILKMERTIHTLYVFIPFIGVLFYHTSLNIKRPYLEIITFAISTVFAFLVHTPYYITDLLTYPWGHIAKGGIVFQIFGVYAFSVLIYGIVISVIKLRQERNELVRLKIKYIILALNLIGIFTVFNVPAMLGYNFYPLSNLMFIPLIFLGYGVLRYRLMDIRSVLHITFIWFCISSVILIPNIIIYNIIYPFFKTFDKSVLFFLLIIWFAVNYFYFIKVQPLIDQIFNRRKYNLKKVESQFINDIALLKDLHLLLNELSYILKRTLLIRNVEIFIKAEDKENELYNLNGDTIILDKQIQDYFTKNPGVIEKKLIENKQQHEQVAKMLLPLFEQLSAEYIIPLEHNEFIGIIALSERSNLKALSNNEIEFLQNIKSASSIAIANSLMYHSLNNLKNNLEALVMQRTEQLQKKNEQMEFELKLAKTVQKTLLPSVLPANNQLYAAVYFRPYMEVSGDFFLLEQIDESHYMIGVVDVSGHGIPSALLTSMIKTEIENLSRLYRSTSVICSQLNKKLTPILQESGFYFTLFLGIIDFVNMELLYTNCGHTDIYVITSNDTVYPLSTDSVFIGADEHIHYPECLFELNTKDRIVLYTDGITEAKAKSGHLYGNERFTNILVASHDFAPQDQIDIVIKDLENFIQSEEGTIRDDVTFCIIEIGEPITVEKYLKKAITLYKKKNYNEALSILNSITTVPLSASYNYLKAKLLMKNKHYEEAKKAILLALKDKPDHKEFNYLYGQICFALKDYQAALDTFADLSMMQPYKKSKEFIEIIQKKGQ
ncbi:MAG: SpoIIE family protein phosphatase [Spirochaetes bacterium]|nr:SpoIIE family protein phosphatase [Spirochaetota bacterium]